MLKHKHVKTVQKNTPWRVNATCTFNFYVTTFAFLVSLNRPFFFLTN